MKLLETFVQISAETKNLELGLKTAKKMARQEVREMNGIFKQLNFDNPIKKLGQMQRAIIALGAGYALKNLAQGFITASNASQSYELRLTSLLRSQSEGKRMFKEMSQFAMEVPQTYKEILEASTRLSSVMTGGVDEVKKWMPIISDLAAVTGMELNDVTQQIIRMYSSSAAAADMFRERGVLAMLGFKAKTIYTVEETRKKIIEAYESADSMFRGASDSLMKTWGGLMSNLQDLWFRFQNLVMDSGLMDYMKSEVSSVLSKINDMAKSGDLERWAKIISDNVVGALKKFKEIIEFLWEKRDIFKTMFEIFIIFEVSKALGAVAFAIYEIAKAFKVLGAIQAFTTFAAMVGNPVSAGILAAVVTGYAAYKFGSSGETPTDPRASFRSPSNTYTRNSNTNVAPYTINGIPVGNMLSMYSNPYAKQYDKDDFKPGKDVLADEKLTAYQEWQKNQKEALQLTRLDFALSSSGVSNNKGLSNISLMKGWNYGESSGLGGMTQKDSVFDPEAFGEMSSTYLEFNQMIDEHLEKTADMREGWKNFGETMSSVLANSVMESGNAFKNIANAFSRMIQVMVAEFASKAAIFALFSLFTGGGIGASNILGSFTKWVFGGGRASGGDVYPNQAYKVGERGEELFIPKTAGKIIPNNQINDSSSLVINFNNSEKDEMTRMSDIQLAERIKKVSRNFNLQVAY
jgi:hypothetical protein